MGLAGAGVAEQHDGFPGVDPGAGGQVARVAAGDGRAAAVEVEVLEAFDAGELGFGDPAGPAAGVPVVALGGEDLGEVGQVGQSFPGGGLGQPGGLVADGGQVQARGQRRRSRPRRRCRHAVIAAVSRRPARSARAGRRSRVRVGAGPVVAGQRAESAIDRAAARPAVAVRRASISDHVGVERARAATAASMPRPRPRGGQGAVRQQHLDQGPGAGGVARAGGGRRPRTAGGPAVNAPAALAWASAVAPGSAPGLRVRTSR